MGLLQKAVETYDAMSHLAGVVVSEDKEPLAPVGHWITKASIEITIDAAGKFVQAKKVDYKIIIPVTENSAGRTSTKIAPHPLCDQISYVSGVNEEKKNKFLIQLNEWNAYLKNEKTEAIFKYVSGSSMISDLEMAGLIKKDEKGQIQNDKDIVCWRVIGTQSSESAVWVDKELEDGYAAYYISKKDGNNKILSLISGNADFPAEQHAKGIFNGAANAKLISTREEGQIKYTGRFNDAEEAVSIGYSDSQKAHNALRWIISTQGVSVGKRVFVCWNPNGLELPPILFPILKFNEKEKRKPSEYKKELYKAIQGYKTALQEHQNAVIASFEAATNGRLAVTYYAEKPNGEFLSNLKDWDDTCCWYDTQWGTNSPRLKDLVRYAFGTQQGNDDSSNIDVDEQLLGQQLQRLVICRINKAPFPMDIMRMVFQKSCNLQIYNKRNKRQLLFNACATIRKYRYDKFKEEWKMALEPDKKDRSYQFGRLLAIFEKAEQDTYDNGESRETNAMRMQSVFSQRPGYATKIIQEKLKSAYFPKLSEGARRYYDKLIGEILQNISEAGASEYNKPLSETYILGYYLQKNDLWTAKSTKSNEEE